MSQQSTGSRGTTNNINDIPVTEHGLAYVCRVPDWYNMRVVVRREDARHLWQGDVHGVIYKIPGWSMQDVPEWARNEEWVGWDGLNAYQVQLYGDMELEVENARLVRFNQKVNMAHMRQDARGNRHIAFGRVESIEWEIGEEHFYTVPNSNLMFPLKVSDVTTYDFSYSGWTRR